MENGDKKKTKKNRGRKAESCSESGGGRRKGGVKAERNVCVGRGRKKGGKEGRGKGNVESYNERSKEKG